MTRDEIIKYLRSSVHIQNEGVEDTAYLSMSDDDLLMFVHVTLSRDLPLVDSVERIPRGSLYPILLLSKRELYYALAVAEAPLVDLTADSGIGIKRSQRFNHYMRLIEETTKEYESYISEGSHELEAGGANTLRAYDVYLDNNYYSKRNRRLAPKPTVSVFVDDSTDTSINISWSAKFLRFNSYEVFISEKLIFDPYAHHHLPEASAIRYALIYDANKNRLRIEGLSQGKTYYIAVKVNEFSGAYGVDEISGETMTVVTP